jgi:membrane fusion protein (multidrug efflux system)
MKDPKPREYHVVSNEAVPGSPGQDWKKHTLQLLVSKKARAVFMAIAALVVLRVGVNAWNHRAVRAVVPQVNVIHPEYKSMDSQLNLPGNIEALEQANLYAHVGGYLKKIEVDEGDHVKKGQLLAEIDAPDIVQDFHRAKAAYDLKSVTLHRQEELLSEKVISQQEFDQATADESEAKARFDNAAANLAYTRIVAPFSGSIARRFKYPGDLITTGSKGSDTPIFVLVNEENMRVAINVPQSELANVKLGDIVDIRVDSLPGTVSHGVVARLDALMDEATKTERVLIDTQDPSHSLHAGMFASVTLHSLHKDHALTLPSEAIELSTQGDPSVWVVRDGKAYRTKVSLGMAANHLTEVLSGIDASAAVILHGATGLVDGAEVDIKK